MNFPEPARRSRDTTMLWAASAAVAGLGTWVMYAALPGLNWVIWTTAATAGLLLFSRSAKVASGPVVVTAVLAAIIAGGAAMTADPFMHALICLAVILLLALQMLLATDGWWTRIAPLFTLAAPVVAFGCAVIESARRALEALHIVRSHRARSVVQGLAITAPVLLVFALLLSSADPVFAQWRAAFEHLLSSWAFLPRTVFFLALLTIVLGAYGFAAKGDDAPTIAALAPPGDRGGRWLGATERLILLGGVALLLWVFLLVQLSYLFGNLPIVAGSGVTFAEYAQRGFAELTVVASASVLLILFAERFGRRGEREALLRAVTIALIVAVLCLLGSAFYRVSLYEEAYGFTTSRLYAQIYMIVVAISLVALAIEVRGEIQPQRVFRRAASAAAIAFITLIYWNHGAWIANRNIDRFATTGKLDTVYLTRDLSPDAVPAIAARLTSLPEPARSELRAAVNLRYRGRHRLLDQRWFEWNRGRANARDALLRLGIPLRLPPRPAVQPGATRP